MIGEQQFSLSDFFLVLATINPAEMGGEGTFALPEAMLDRFTISLQMDYISRAGEIEMLRRSNLHGRHAAEQVQAVVTLDDVYSMREGQRQVVENTIAAGKLLEYIVDVVRATRPGDHQFERLAKNSQYPLIEYVQFGLSPRAEIGLLHLAGALAYLDGREVANPDDVKSVYRAVARHRLILKESAALSDFTPDHFINEVIGPNGVPVVSM